MHTSDTTILRYESRCQYKCAHKSQWAIKRAVLKYNELTLLVDVPQHDGAAQPREPQRDEAAEPAAAAGDQGYVALQVPLRHTHHCPVYRLDNFPDPYDHEQHYVHYWLEECVLVAHAGGDLPGERPRPHPVDVLLSFHRHFGTNFHFNRLTLKHHFYWPVAMYIPARCLRFYYLKKEKKINFNEIISKRRRIRKCLHE